MNTADMIEHGGHAAALAWHLQHNHYPPVLLRMIPTCRDAIAAAAAGDWDTLAALPDGVTYRGRNTAPVWAIIEAHHLAPFVADAEGVTE